MTRPDHDLVLLQDRLGYAFKDEELLTEALSHPSLGGRNYQRLEYLGDAVASLVVAHGLYVRRGEADEGELTQSRAALVKRAALGELGRALGLDEAMRVDPGLRSDANVLKAQEKSRGDMLEAVLAAVFLDGGYGPAEQVLRRLLEGCWELKPEQDTRILLNELCQERFKKPARWGDGVMTGDAHMPSWSIEVHLPDADGRSFRGEAKAEGGRSASKDDAKRAAAAVALETLGSEG